jgi:hypothetical protein
MRRFLAKKLRPSPALIVAIAALVVALGGVAYATIPDSNGVIRGCYLKAIGSLRVVDPSAGQHCATAVETPIQWNQTGLQGPAGPTGPQGPAGPTMGIFAPPGPANVDLTPDSARGGSRARFEMAPRRVSFSWLTPHTPAGAAS